MLQNSVKSVLKEASEALGVLPPKRNDWGSWAVETIDCGEFIGFVGFSYPAEWHPCAGSVEIGWRLCRQHWGRGYATEAAKYVLAVGFELLEFERDPLIQANRYAGIQTVLPLSVRSTLTGVP